CGVGNKGKDRIFKVVIDAIQHLIDQFSTQLFPFEINITIGSPGKINPFKTTRQFLTWFGERYFLHGTILFHREHVTGLQFLDIAKSDVKGGLDGGPLAGSHHYFIIVVIIGWSDAVGIPHHKSIPMTDKTTQDVASIPLLAGSSE